MNPAEVLDLLLEAQTDVCSCAKRLAKLVQEYLVWRPMENAPRGGTGILGRLKNGQIEMIYWTPERMPYAWKDGAWVSGQMWFFDESFTGWLPLPPSEKEI